MQLFQEAYKQVNYLNFLDEKFNFNKFIKPLSVNNNEVEKFKKLGFITTADNKQLPVFEIYIKPNTQLSRNRVQLRNLVAKQIEIEEGALAVYVDKQNEQWRFSFIAIEYKFNDKGEPIKAETASKRFTYLLGKEAQTRTIIKRFGRLDKQSTLADLKNAFAVESLSKEFYEKLYTWYEKAQKEVVFPNDEHAKNHTQTSLIRLITRLLFVWFLKQKQLINKDLFECDKLKVLLDYDKDSSFYKAILQNLFFATLSTEIHNRKFSSEIRGHKGHNPDFGNQYVFRYQDIFIEQNESKIMALFAEIPFLNGGLFDCLDDKKKGLYIDGFSRTKKHQPIVPNNLFFSNDDNDEKNLGLIDLLGQYQFTTQESTPLDIEVALDPELLGKVFENLLASYNPETGQQARKATGSFYTPREIVNYMVDESLKAYLQQQVPPDDNDVEFYKERLDDLLINSDKTGELIKDDANLIYDKEIPKLIAALSQIKILDPAVGSGAYPMGLLQRMTALLAILDPDNTKWKAQQLQLLPSLQSIEQDIKTSEKINDTQAKQKAQEELNKRKNEIETNFNKQDHNYLRKLYLIENCIYGVDIQPIAIQICKLRFFISLTIEQNSNNNADDNYGIKALPNLETKFIVANTLLPLGEIPDKGQPGLFDTGIKELQKQLATVRHDHFNAKTFNTKLKYRNEDKNIRQQMLTSLKESGISTTVESSMQKVVAWDLYNQNAVAEWFDPEWMFGINNGFDIVLGNPPYIKEYTYKEAFNHLKGQSYYQGKMDIWTFFTCKGIDLLKNNAVLSFIAPNNWVSNSGASKVRNKILTDSKILEFIDFGNFMVFENALIQTMIVLLKKQQSDSIYTTKFSKLLDSQLLHAELTNFLNKKEDKRFLSYMSQINKEKLIDKNITFLQKSIARVLDKIIKSKNFELDKNTEITNGLQVQQEKVNKKSLKILGKNFNIGDGIFNLTDAEKVRLKFTENELKLIKPLYTSSEINRYYANKNNKFWVIYTSSKFKNIECIEPYPNLKKHLDKFKKIITTDNKPYGIHRTRNESFFKGEKIISLRKSPNKPSFSYVDFDSYVNQAFYVIQSDRINLKYLTALFNSKMIAFWLRYQGKMQGSNYQIDKEPLLDIPLVSISKSAQQPFIALVDKILTAKQNNQDTTALEATIDQMVYKLYNLTPDEIKIIEAKK